MRGLRLGVVLAGVMVFASAGYAQSSNDASSLLSKANKDNDKTLSMQEVNSYAAQQFAKLNATGSKTLSQKELEGRLSDAGFNTANTNFDKKADRTISKREFMGYVDRLFKEANNNHDGTLSVAELQTPAGQKLVTLLD